VVESAEMLYCSKRSEIPAVVWSSMGCIEASEITCKELDQSLPNCCDIRSSKLLNRCHLKMLVPCGRRKAISDKLLECHE